jgi:hypothetical protein
MANAFFPEFKQTLISTFLGAGATVPAATVKAALVSSSYTYNSAHNFYDDVSATVLGTPQTLGTKTYVNGTFDAADITFSAVSGGATAKAVVIYIDTGVAGTSRLIAYLDTLTNLPIATNGGDLIITWDAAGIFTI